MIFTAIFLAFTFPAMAGNDYSDYRKSLISKGWNPSPQTAKTDCYNRMETKLCRDFPEIRHCAGSGVAPCIMEWTRNGKTITIKTAGETDLQIVEIVK